MHAVADAETLTERETQLSEINVGYFESIFIPRFRDANPDIRICCLNAIGRCVVVHPAQYLTDNYLKYLGWQMNDAHSSQVRLTAVHQLQSIYRQVKQERLADIAVFTQVTACSPCALSLHGLHQTPTTPPPDPTRPPPDPHQTPHQIPWIPLTTGGQDPTRSSRLEEPILRR